MTRRFELLKPGFTLSELLIVLALLGVIATFTISKVTSGASDAKQKATLKSAIQTLNSVFIPAADAGTLNVTKTIYAVVTEGANIAKVCATALTDGCWSGSTLGATYEQSGVVLPSGVFVTGLSSTIEAGSSKTIALDADGASGPYSTGKDLIRLTVCLTSTGCSTTTGHSAKYGELYPISSDATYYDQIMSL